MAAKQQQLNITDESRSVTKTILLLAWPVFVEQVFTTLVSFADTAMVGSMGAQATAAISISNSPIFLLNGIIMALGVGLTALIARAAGAGETEKVRKLMRHAIMVVLYIGLPITIVVAALSRMIPLWMGAGEDILDAAAQYNLIVASGRLFNLTAVVLNSAFRGYGDTKTPMKVNVLMNVINVVGNFFLIYPTRRMTVLGFSITMPGAGWGVNGAAAATAFSMAVAGFLALHVAFNRQNPYCIRFRSLRDLRPDNTLTRQIFSISFPAMLERIFMSSSGIFVTSSIATLGTVSIAANSLSLSAESLSYMPAFAFQTAITTLVGQALGAGKPKLAEKFVRTTMTIGIAIMCVTGLGLYVFSDFLIGLFTPDQEVVAMAASCLRLMAYIQPVQLAAWVLTGVMRGAGDTKVNFYITAATNWGIRTLFSVVAVRVLGMDLYATYIVIIIEIWVRLALLYIRYRTGKWKTIMKAEESN